MTQRHERVGLAMRDLIDSTDLPGATWALIERDGPEIVTTIGSAGIHSDDTIFRIASITKTIGTVLTATLVNDEILSWDDRVDQWVPEIAERTALRTPQSALDDGVPLNRPLLLADVLQMGIGIGWGTAITGSPLEAAVIESELTSTWFASPLTPKEWAVRLGQLPMAHQPGEGWLYQMSFDLLTIILERATGRGADELLRERVLGPLGMDQTGWQVPADRLDRVPAQFFPNRKGRRVQVAPPADPSLTERPVFRSFAAGLLSTATDLAAFASMLLSDGAGPTGRLLPAGQLAELTRDRRSPAAFAMGADFLGPTRGWGTGFGVDLAPAYPGSQVGRFGWDGGTGASLWTDPEAGVSAVILTQHGIGDLADVPYLDAFWSAVYGH